MASRHSRFSSSLRSRKLQRPPHSQRSTPRLPHHLQRKVLSLLIYEVLLEQGPADADETIQYLPPLSLVSKSWEQYVRHAYTNWIAFDLRELIRMDDGTYDVLNLETLETSITQAFESRCIFRSKQGIGGLKLLLNGPELKEHGKVWQKLFGRILNKFSNFAQLNLELHGEGTETFFEICRRFTREFLLRSLVPLNGSGLIPQEVNWLELTKLCLQSKEHFAHLSFNRSTLSATHPSTLTRLDLSGIVIRDWQIDLPAVRTLTLCFVSFKSERKLESLLSTDDLCRRFLDSFGNLQSLGIEGIQNVSPSSFSRLKVFSISRLYVGDPSSQVKQEHREYASDPLVPSLTRYLHAQIKNLVFSPNQNSMPLLERLVLGRNGRTPPSSNDSSQ